METNYGERSAPLRRITLRREGFFRVVSIEEDVDEQEVFCAVVPKTADFTLANGIHTGKKNSGSSSTYRRLTSFHTPPT